MKKNLPLYLLAVSLLAVAVYLKSSVIAVSIVALWGINASETIFTRKNRDLDIVSIEATLASHKAKMESLSRDVVNVADRARTILGENF